MGCDIHVLGQRKENGQWVDVETEAFGDRTYGRFGFLADVRNYSAVKPISSPRGWPKDFTASEDFDMRCDHSHSWLSVDELLAFDYETMTEDRRYMGRTADGFNSGALTSEPGHGNAMTYREFLGPGFFDDLSDLAANKIERIVFGFDS